MGSDGCLCAEKVLAAVPSVKSFGASRSPAGWMRRDAMVPASGRPAYLPIRRSSGMSDLWMPTAARTPSAAARMASLEPGTMSPAA
jgi:hypothetical protein